MLGSSTGEGNTAMFQGNELSSTKCNVDQLQLSFEDNVDMFWLRKLKILVVNETYHKGSDFEGLPLLVNVAERAMLSGMTEA